MRSPKKTETIRLTSIKPSNDRRHTSPSLLSNGSKECMLHRSRLISRTTAISNKKLSSNDGKNENSYLTVKENSVLNSCNSKHCNPQEPLVPSIEVTEDKGCSSDSGSLFLNNSSNIVKVDLLINKNIDRGGPAISEAIEYKLDDTVSDDSIPYIDSNCLKQKKGCIASANNGVDWV